MAVAELLAVKAMIKAAPENSQVSFKPLNYLQSIITMLLDVKRSGVNVTEEATRRESLLPCFANEIYHNQEEIFRDKKRLGLEVVKLSQDRSVYGV